MDTITFTIAILLMMIAVQFNQNWMMFAIVALMVLTLRDLMATILLFVATGVLLFGKEYIPEYWPWVLFGLIILGVVLSGKQKQEASPYQDMFGQGDLGGIGMGGGY